MKAVERAYFFLPGQSLQRLPFLYFLQHFLWRQHKSDVPMPFCSDGSVGTEILSFAKKSIVHVFIQTMVL